MRRLATPFYPILLGVIWVLITYSANRLILPSPRETIIPILVVSGIIAAVWAVTQLIVRDWRKSALIVAVIFCITIAHGYIRDYTNIAGIKLAPIWLAFIVVGVLSVVKITRPKGRENLTIVCNVLCVSILIVSLVTSLTDIAFERSGTYSPVTIREEHNPKPDVYYIIPDTYTSQFILSNYLDFDNSEFMDFLDGVGFEVNESSYANYHHSILSISSVLNLDYWTEEGLGLPTRRKLGDALYQNPVGDTFVEAGYTYIHMGSWWSFTSSNAVANITSQFSNLSELSFELYRMTLWYDLLDYFFDAGGNRILREATLNQIYTLPEIAEMEEPTFTFCHLILPHPPFLFDSEGNHVSGWSMPPDEWKRMYLEQLQFTNRVLEQTINQIITGSSITPIIIICSDEGYASTEWQEYWSSHHSLKSIVVDKPDLVYMRQGNIIAVLNPYGDPPSSPVNIFRCTFNCLFDSQLEYLPDRYFLSGIYEKPIEITEFING